MYVTVEYYYLSIVDPKSDISLTTKELDQPPKE